MDCSRPGFSVHGVSQPRILGLVTISFSRESSCSCHNPTHLLQCKQILYHWALPYSRGKTQIFSSTVGETQFFSAAFLSWNVKVKVAHSCPTLRPHGLYSPWNSPGQNTRVGSCSLLQGIFPTQGSNPRLLLYQQILYQLSHLGSPSFLGVSFITHTEPFTSDTSCHQVWREGSPQQWAGLGHQLGVLQFSSVLTLSTRR